MYNGYDFYFKDGNDVLLFPITPPTLSVSIGSNNQVVTLINEGEINILKSPSLMEIEFEARFPMIKYPYSREVKNFQTYYDKFKELKEKKKSFRFIVARKNPKAVRTWDTNILVALEEMDFNEDADEGNDVLITFRLKQYKEYGVKTLQTPQTNTTKAENASKDLPTSTSTSPVTRPTENKTSQPQSYTIKSGDTLWGISKQFYGNGNLYKTIYDANKNIIENEAKKHGKQSSSNGHWIYPNVQITIPSR